MSTSDPGSAERPALVEQGPAVPAEDSRSVGVFALPDPAVIARLANEFFAALPGAENVGASAPARATAGALPVASSPSPPTEVPVNPLAFAQQFPDTPVSPAVPGSTGYFFDRASPLNTSPSLPSLNEAFAFPGVPGAQAMPGIPGMPVPAPNMPLSEADLRAIPASLGNVPVFAPAVPSASSLPLPGSSAYFLDLDKVAPLTIPPSFPDIAGIGRCRRMKSSCGRWKVTSIGLCRCFVDIFKKRQFPNHPSMYSSRNG